MTDLMSAGLPPRVLNYVDGFNLCTTEPSGVVKVSWAFMCPHQSVSIDTSDLENESGVARNTIVHELGHALDYGEMIILDPNWDVDFLKKLRASWISK